MKTVVEFFPNEEDEDQLQGIHKKGDRDTESADAPGAPNVEK